MPTAVLFSGGLDSAVLVADEASRGDVQPIYVSFGLAWEVAERETVDRLLASEPFRGRTRPLVSLAVDMRDVYEATHWAIEGKPPSYHTSDEDVYLPGRNVILLGKAGVYCAAAGLDRIVLGTLGHNPFPDATPEFRRTMARALSLGLAHELTIDAPFADTIKADVVRRGIALGVPWELTLSCMNPQRRGLWPVVSGPSEEHRRPPTTGKRPDDRTDHWPMPTGHYVHCGLCSKCRERHDAFLDAGVKDPTGYADTTHVARAFQARERRP